MNEKNNHIYEAIAYTALGALLTWYIALLACVTDIGGMIHEVLNFKMAKGYLLLGSIMGALYWYINKKDTTKKK